MRATSTSKASPAPTHSEKQSNCSQPPTPPTYTSIMSRPTAKSTQRRATGSDIGSRHATSTSEGKLVPKPSVKQSESAQSTLPSTHAAGPAMKNPGDRTTTISTSKVTSMPTHSVQDSGCSQPPTPPTYVAEPSPRNGSGMSKASNSNTLRPKQ
ncbi:hypothetical protein K493DRAFT_278547 [Basidiobolus meristosporus CBS 931.73]|uniref:Uncharacterized protein n=1 Tax=Basidiobolus meristosporus CBS 931.73 TaxID=1314790 RepID=A0A1Y1YS64_9FUNG|nr:hypothetical protein K493DRAFT_278547 [Basidiobolus meristosporus CBS 931.73]|eukprot:ORY00816.1 hypothetical protein K493DRAFT_278547 [Basidiobolus meristosporus CBS 931.73]